MRVHDPPILFTSIFFLNSTTLNSLNLIGVRLILEGRWGWTIHQNIHNLFFNWKKKIFKKPTDDLILNFLIGAVIGVLHCPKTIHSLCFNFFFKPHYT